MLRAIAVTLITGVVTLQAQPGRTVYYALHEGEAIRLTLDDLQTTVQPLVAALRRQYGAVSLTGVEAGEILRGNEAVRDGVIARECGERGACGGAIHGAAIEAVAGLQRATERSLQALLAADLASMRGATLVLLTAGLPYREEPGALISRIADRIRDAGATLEIVRLNSSVVYTGFLRDAVDRLASRVPRTRVVRVGDERALAGVVAELAAALQPQSAAPAQVETSDAVPARTAATAPMAPAVDRPRPGRTDAGLDKASAFVAEFERVFSAIIWHETYVQEERSRQRFTSSGATFYPVTDRRRLESELLFVWVPTEATWLAVRDVISVDGRVLAPAERRLQPLLARPTVSLDQLRALSEENGRFNIGTIVRTFNEPTLALLFLDARYRSRFDFTRGHDTRIDGAAASVFDFVERARPTVIRNGDRDVPSQGTLWIEPSTGRLLQTMLEMVDPAVGLRGRVTVSYKPDARLGTVVPVEMKESYRSFSGEQIDCTAAYSDFRRFETAGRLIIPK